MEAGDTEVESLNDLERIIARAGQFGIRLVLIGGYAVRAYTRGYRYTKDIDFVMSKKDIGGIVALLKEFGYEVSETEFGIAGRKTITAGRIDLHISTGEVYDASTGSTYPFSDDRLAGAAEREITGFLPRGKDIRVSAPVVLLEDLLILKLMMRDREKDYIDIVSLLFDCGNSVDIDEISRRCEAAGLSGHIRARVQDFMGKLRTGIIRRSWEKASGARLQAKDETKIRKLLRDLERLLA